MIGFISNVSVTDGGPNVSELYDGFIEIEEGISVDGTLTDNAFIWIMLHSNDLIVPAFQLIPEKTVQCALELRESYEHGWKIIKLRGLGECT
jgi:hypothetical protein